MDNAFVWPTASFDSMAPMPLRPEGHYDYDFEDAPAMSAPFPSESPPDATSYVNAGDMGFDQLPMLPSTSSIEPAYSLMGEDDFALNGPALSSKDYDLDAFTGFETAGQAFLPALFSEPTHSGSGVQGYTYEPCADTVLGGLRSPCSEPGEGYPK